MDVCTSYPTRPVVVLSIGLWAKGLKYFYLAGPHRLKCSLMSLYTGSGAARPIHQNRQLGLESLDQQGIGNNADVGADTGQFNPVEV